MNGESLNIQKENIEKLKQLFPELFSENQLDWEKLKAAFSNNINFANERYVLNGQVRQMLLNRCRYQQLPP